VLGELRKTPYEPLKEEQGVLRDHDGKAGHYFE